MSKLTVLILLIGIVASLINEPALAQTAIAATSTSERSDEIQGMSRERLARIALVIKEQVAKGMFPGAVTIIARNGEIVHFEAHGFQDAAKTKAMAKDSIFRWASMTKPIVTAAAMMLVEQGTIKLNDPISDLLPELKELKVETQKLDKDGNTIIEDVPAIRPITIHDLLRHTSGFFYSNESVSQRLKKAYREANIEGLAVPISGDEMLKRLGKIPLAHQPGTTFHYSISVDVLGLLLERAANKRLDHILQDMVIGTLGMKDTAFWVPPDKTSRLAELLDSDPMKHQSLAFCTSESVIKQNYFKGGAGLCGTAEDYLRFLQMIVNKGEYGGRRFLSKKTVEFMLSDHTAGLSGSTEASTGPGYGFGLGFAVRLDDGAAWTAGTKGDATWGGAFGTSFTIDPKEKMVAVELTQGATPRLQSRLLFKNLIYGAITER
jgi:CubicO group peptidase (beta-lactamase class C family)